MFGILPNLFGKCFWTFGYTDWFFRDPYIGLLYSPIWLPSIIPSIKQPKTILNTAHSHAFDGQGHTTLFLGLWCGWWHHFVWPGLRLTPIGFRFSLRCVQLFPSFWDRSKDKNGCFVSNVTVVKQYFGGEWCWKPIVMALYLKRQPIARLVEVPISCALTMSGDPHGVRPGGFPQVVLKKGSDHRIWDVLKPGGK